VEVGRRNAEPRANAPIRYLAEPGHVREVSLRGSADLAFWSARLEPENLRPAEQGGRAQILLVAAEMKFMGVRFAEVSFSVLVDVPGPESTEGAFLVHAFNGCRFFAYCERRFFATPYTYANCHVAVGPRALVQVTSRGQAVFRAERGPRPERVEGPDAAAAPPSICRQVDTWEGPVFLPTRGGAAEGEARFFFARMRGPATVSPFLGDVDLFILSAAAESSWRLLHDSDFKALEWLVRPDATHGKSKTYRRGDFFPSLTAR